MLDCSIMAIEVLGGFDEGNRDISCFKTITFSPSLRGTTTIISNPTFTLNRTLPKVKREVTGIAYGMFAILVGLEYLEYIWNDIELGLDVVVNAIKLLIQCSLTFFYNWLECFLA